MTRPASVIKSALNPSQIQGAFFSRRSERAALLSNPNPPAQFSCLCSQDAR